MNTIPLFGITALCALLALAPVTSSAEGLSADTFSADTKDGLSYASPGGGFKFKVGGRLHLDNADYDEDKTPLEDDWMVRRARISFGAKLFHDWRFSLQYDLVDKEERFQSLWLRYSGFESLDITVGQFDEPFSLEKMTSSNNITFMERSLASALAPGTNVGIAVRRWGGHWGATAGVFWETYIEESDPFATREGMGLSGRLSFAPLNRKARTLHLGFSGSYRVPDERDRVRFRTRPESRVTDVRLISTKRIKKVDGYATGGAEAALVLGPFSLQGEYIQSSVFRQEGLDTETFDGGYVFASVFLTGEHRPYSARSGAFGRVIPKGPWGAWEVAVRQSYLDLNSSSGTVLGGKQANLTWGLNWYPHRSVRFMVNYIQVDTDEHAGDDDPSIVQVRAQVAI